MGAVKGPTAFFTTEEVETFEANLDVVGGNEIF